MHHLRSDFPAGVALELPDFAAHPNLLARQTFSAIPSPGGYSGEHHGRSSRQRPAHPVHERRSVRPPFETSSLPRNHRIHLGQKPWRKETAKPDFRNCAAGPETSRCSAFYDLSLLGTAGLISMTNIRTVPSSVSIFRGSGSCLSCLRASKTTSHPCRLFSVRIYWVSCETPEKLRAARPLAL